MWLVDHAMSFVYIEPDNLADHFVQLAANRRRETPRFRQ